ncbi:MAG: AI-2E family transporter, partial [Caldilineaceae bacterium]|nr:AI-2E family transporter [Caldilineaceae bacterium]
MSEQANGHDIVPAEPKIAQPQQPPNDSLVAVIDRVADPTADSQWDLSTKRTVLVIMLVVIVFVIYISRSIVPMVLIAAILAYLLSPIVTFAQRFRIPRLASTLAIYLLIVTLLVLVPIIFIPTLVDQLRALATFDASGAARSVLA